MKYLSSVYRVGRRFQRAVRVDADLGAPDALSGYICSPSAVDALLVMGRHLTSSGHGAFTWTGPYGSGKSSLAIALAAVCTKPETELEPLLTGVPQDDRRELIGAFRDDKRAWMVAAAVGRRDDPARVLEAALSTATSGIRDGGRKRDEPLVAWALRLARRPETRGLVLFVDEMGKLLEHAARDGGDVHLFQELAEAAARSGGRLVVVGILHQAFDEYAHRLAREARDEWLKVQGRYVDIPINLASDEQLDLVGRAIEGPAGEPEADINVIARALHGERPGDSSGLARRLAACRPLHPVSAALLGPISRRRFGQNQRSLFGFLNSAEPFGFQSFLSETPSHIGARFGPDRLFDYLHVNLESAILASPDGHRWATALDAISRAEARGAGPLHLQLLKTIAIIDLFKDRSGLRATLAVLGTVSHDEAERQAALADLARWSVVVWRAHLGAFAVYAGSDFDIDAAVQTAKRSGVTLDFRRLTKQAALQPILAKRHYETTGALRWFEAELSPLCGAEERVAAYKPTPGAAGLFLLAVGTDGEDVGEARRVLARVQAATKDRLVVCGWARDSYMIRELAADLAALEHVRAHRPELEGDAVARREIDARLARLAADLEDRLVDALQSVEWRLPDEAPLGLAEGLAGSASLSILASRLCDWRYPDSPRLPNELLNRTRPSANAAAAVRGLLRAMVERPTAPRLGFEGYPPEAGLYVSLLESTGLHRFDSDTDAWRFGDPELDANSRLAPLWKATDALLEERPDGASVADLFALWRNPPFGVRDGLSPVLALAYLLSRAGRTAVYLNGAFRPALDTFLVDRLLQDASAVGIRTVELTEVDTGFVAELAARLSTPDAPVPATPLAVARAFIREVQVLPAWTLRTGALEGSVLKLRDRAKVSSDPNRLLLEEAPNAFGLVRGEVAGPVLARKVADALTILRGAYEAMLGELQAVLLRELRVRGTNETSLAALRRRADAVRGLTGNFRLDALATRLVAFSGGLSDMEGLASLAANKPPRDWTDRDVDAARVELAALAQQFLKAEGLARVKGRADGRVALAVYISDPAYPEPCAREVELSATERRAADALAASLRALIRTEGASPEVALAALASLGLDFDVALPEGGAALAQSE